MTEMQSKLLEMMKYLHRICVENDIRYYASGGTCLGAVRHHGFIPWDDDIDIGVPRHDYEKLIEVLKTEKGQYELECPLENKDFVYMYCKLYDTKTTLTEKTRYKTRRGVFIDIFPLDGAGDTKEEALRQFKRTERYSDYNSIKVCALSAHRKFYKNAAIILGRMIPEFVFGRSQAQKKADAICKEKDWDKSLFVANMYGGWRSKEVMERSIFGTPVLCPFEDMEMYIPEDADAYLKNMYGNYMELPPVEDRVTHHNYLYMNLNQSYKNK